MSDGFKFFLSTINFIEFIRIVKYRMCVLSVDYLQEIKSIYVKFSKVYTYIVIDHFEIII